MGIKGWTRFVVATACAVAVVAGADELAVRRNLAQAALLVGDYEHAVTLADEILATWPDDAATRLIRGLARVGLGEYTDAEADLTAAKPYFPDEVAIPYNLALIAEKQADHRAALQYLDEAFAGGLEKNDAYLLKAQILDNLGRRAEAREMLEAYVAKRPGSRETYLILAQWARADGEYAKAIEYYDAALARLRDGATLAELGATYRAAGDRAHAVTCYEEAIAKGAASGDALAEFAADYAAAGDYESARGIYERLVGRFPANGRYRFGLAFVEQQLGMEAEAEAGYRKAVALEPSFAEAYYNLGALADAAENEADAITYYRKFLEYAAAREDLAANRAKAEARLALLEGK